jgi:hypothetical protein
MRRATTILFTLMLGQCVDGSMPAVITPVPNQSITINSTPVALDTTNPGRRRVGALTFRGAWHLTSDTRGFGGLSALDVNDNRVTALGDGGTVIRFRLGRFGNASDATITRLPDQCGHVARKMDNDTESLAHDGTRTGWWIGFEWRNAICRTNADFSAGRAIAQPRAISRWPRKGGAESMTRFSDGRFVLIAEESIDDGGVHKMVVFDRDPTDPAAIATTLGYRPPAGYKPTDIAQLPDGRMLVLNRRFALWSLFTSKLVLIDALPSKPSGVLKGRTIAHFESPVIAENFEGLSVSVENGKAIIWIISDDNFMRWQRTLLLKFSLN